ncbi:heme ABC exporter ATP-binding protein CcmA [Acuticoccus sp.]|uniref:heme ABC exporter ATP-binding protein CcmA n=1 Tax=Acuticoccus sp. TaxID=1904378 RepID=UPI003B51B552
MLTLEAVRLAVDRGGRRVVDALSFRVAPGEALAVVGPNGAGKSTLLRAVAGLCPLAGGRLSLAPWDGPRGSAVHLVGHQNALKLALSAFDNLAFVVRTLGAADPRPDARELAVEAVVEDALDRLGLLALAETPAALLSQGQRRRLALARLAAVPRPVWLLDEPTAGLDAAARRAFCAMMSAHLAEGGTILAATHEPLEVPASELALLPQHASFEAA